MGRKIIAPRGIAFPLGPYSMGIACEGPGTWLHIAGQIGVAPDGVVPRAFEEQASLAWSNLVAVLQSSDMTVEHLVKVTTFLTCPSDTAVFGAVRLKFLDQARPASTLLIVQALAKPEWLVEIEGIAFRPE